MAESDANVREIVKQIFAVCSSHELFQTDANTPAILIDKDFVGCLRKVVFTTHLLNKRRWIGYIEKCQYEILFSLETYISHVIYASRMEEYLHLNAFERFLGVCCTTIMFSIDTYYKTDVNLDQLSLDIFMAYYEKHLKKNFNKCGGFQRLVDYIRQHKYSKWGVPPEALRKMHPSKTIEDLIGKDVAAKLNKEFEKQHLQLNSRNCDQNKEMGYAEYLARQVLSTTKTELPSWPNLEEVEMKIRSKDEIIQRKFYEQLLELQGIQSVESPGVSLQSSSDSAAKEREFEETKVKDSAERQQTEAEQNIDDLSEAVKGLSISNSDCKPKLDVKLSEFEEQGHASTERKLTAERIQQQHDTDVGLPDLQISNAGSKPNAEVELEMNSERCENVEAVGRYMDSKSARNLSAKHSMQRQVCESLKHVQGSIKSLIEFLDQYDKE